MTSRYLFIINFLLIIFNLFLGNKIYQVWTSNKYEQSPKLIKGNAPIFSELKLNESQNLIRKDYQVIIDKDLFRPERTEWKPPAKPTPEKTVSKENPKINVYGIVISDNFKYAWIREANKKEKLKKVSQGETITDWKVDSIEPDFISLKKGEETVKYYLIEPGKPKQRKIPKSLHSKKPRKKTTRKASSTRKEKGRKR
ncbi:MAG: hypothetical protein DRG25_01305 [Deltaproteobacteria bacterium]|nr:MAG: hypothetical protein DRG25_01305 [Deltaproteobacteria bacterium]